MQEEKKLDLNLPVQVAQIGDKVKINWGKKGYYGKSVRRGVIDEIMESWRRNSLDNLKTEFERNFVYKFDSTESTLKTYKDILKGKRSCEGSVFKRHQECKDWLRTSIDAIDNFIDAVVVGVEMHTLHMSSNSPSNICYINKGGSLGGSWYCVYKIVIHGTSPCKQRAGEHNHVQFTIELFEEDFEVLK